MEAVKNILKKFFKGKSLAPLYTNREERYKFIFKKFKDYLKESVLDVGCSGKYLKSYLTDDIKYVGIDIEGEPDIKVDLEKDKLSMFEDNSFYIIVCTEVLEHLDNLHEVFDELTRVSKKYIILSLPNSWYFYKFPLVKGKSNDPIKFYGLPKEKPLDRHKWFFNYDEAIAFIKYRANKNGFFVKTYFSNPKSHRSLRHSIMDLLFRIYYNKNYGYNNLHSVHLWALLESRREI